MAVGETAGKSHTVKEHSPGDRVGVDDRAWGGVRNLERLVVVFIANEDVAVLQKFSAVRIVEQPGADAGDTGGAILPDRLHGDEIDLNDALVGLVRDEHMAARNSAICTEVLVIAIVAVATRKPCSLHRRIQLTGVGTAGAELPILPYDMAGAVHQEHPIVGAAGGVTAVGGFRLSAGSTGAGHQCQFTDALSIVDANDGRGREVRGTQTKMPHDVAVGVDFNHTIVELIGNEGIAGLIKPAGQVLTRSAG